MGSRMRNVRAITLFLFPSRDHCSASGSEIDRDLIGRAPADRVADDLVPILVLVPQLGERHLVEGLGVDHHGARPSALAARAACSSKPRMRALANQDTIRATS